MKLLYFKEAFWLLSVLCLSANSRHVEEVDAFHSVADIENLLNMRYPVSQVSLRGDAGEKLLLSSYVEKGAFGEAKDLSRVDPEHFVDGLNSHAGYITVDKKYNSSLWFWYFPAKDISVEDAPFLIWLQGGPGASSLYGLFEELGPFSVNEDGATLKENPYSWHKNHSILFIDNPVGTGFSNTDSEDGYATNQTQIAEHLYIFLQQFLQIFPELQKVPLYITGESYAGKHIPSFAYQIHKRNPDAELKINLKGMAIGNGFIDPPTIMDYSSFVQQLGLADDNTVAKMRGLESEAEAAMKQNDLRRAYYYFVINMDLLTRTAKLKQVYNFAYERDFSLNGYFTKFIQRPEIRRALHVGSTEFTSIGKVYDKLIGDFMGSAKPQLEELLENYKVLAYSGQNDIIVAYPLSVRTYRSLKWSDTPKYLLSLRKPWYFGKLVVGYVKKAGNFQEVLVRNAGHMVPTDQPKRALHLISSFVRDIPLDTDSRGKQ